MNLFHWLGADARAAWADYQTEQQKAAEALAQVPVVDSTEEE